ncbi:hypothetical protein N7455_011348 [Penicillium solitum]|uniref:uncharacterized protein n=1 Tax=Penicillium solitum TaxID=60172 RepID=UPI0032C41BC3|nr:hypothetical protein N7455_011348 [Penicillium solitum]
MSASGPIQNSVVQTSHYTWCLGCTIEWDRISGSGDMGAAASWKDGEHWYILRRVNSEQQPVTTPTNSDEVRVIHEGGTVSAVWAIGNNAICKVYYWSSDITSECETVKFIQERAPKVPVPEVIYSWVDGNLLQPAPGLAELHTRPKRPLYQSITLR